jgi:hypothetical protein
MSTSFCKRVPPVADPSGHQLHRRPGPGTTHPGLRDGNLGDGVGVDLTGALGQHAEVSQLAGLQRPQPKAPPTIDGYQEQRWPSLGRAPLTPEVLFCAPATVTIALALVRCSAPERVRSITDSGTVDGTHSTGC